MTASDLVQVGIAAHRDEPSLTETLRAVLDDVERHPPGAGQVVVRVVVNGPDPTRGPAHRAVEAVAAGSPVPVLVETSEVASKPAAWTRLRASDADIAVFVDADVVVEPGSIAALVDCIDGGAAVAAGRQVPWPPTNSVQRVAAVPHRLTWNTLAGTLYAARTSALPAEMPAVLLDDAWLHATVGFDAVVRCEAAVARFGLPATVGDLWRQRVRAEAGKQQLVELGLALAPPPGPRRQRLRHLGPADLAGAVALGGLKAAAAVAARRRRPSWGWSASSKA